MEDPQPALIPPWGEGYMPLYCAAQWIATCGHSVAWDVPADEVWKAAYRDLLDAIASEAVKAIGDFEGKIELVPPLLFAGCEATHYGNQFIPEGGDRYYLSSAPYIDEGRWRDGFDDALIGRSGASSWRRIMVLKRDVQKLWPFAGKKNNAQNYGTGMPGRPSSAHLIEAEHIARWERGEAALTLAEEARLLSQWLARAHPGAARAKPTSVEHMIRSEYRSRKADRNRGK